MKFPIKNFNSKKKKKKLKLFYTEFLIIINITIVRYFFLKIFFFTNSIKIEVLVKEISYKITIISLINYKL